MHIAVRGKNLKISDDFRELIIEKVQKLERYIDKVNSAEVEVSSEKSKIPDSRHVVQLTIHVNGAILRAEDHEADAKAALDIVVDKMHKQIDRYKSRFDRRGRMGQGRAAAAIVNAEDEETTEKVAPIGHKDIAEEGVEVINRPTRHGVVRSKRFDMKPMYPDEAIEQMELLGHSWFVFYDAETEKVSVIYRRDDGTYGLIEPTRA